MHFPGLKQRVGLRLFPICFSPVLSPASSGGGSGSSSFDTPFLVNAGNKLTYYLDVTLP